MIEETKTQMALRNNRNAETFAKSASAKKEKRPRLPMRVQVKLWALAGGRCEFYGCNEPLWVDSLTFSETNYSNIAHIVSWSEDGPRGSDPMPADERNKFENLMLVCTKHHLLIDSREQEAEYPRELLLRHKRLHEERIATVTAYHPHQKTTIVRLKAHIEGKAVSVSIPHMREAIAPRYPADAKGIEIDLTEFPMGNSEAHWQTMSEVITQKLAEAYKPGIETDAVEHLSVFAIGPMPILMHLGGCLSDKVPVALYQLHRDTQEWCWRQDGDDIKYRTQLLKPGPDLKKVALILSLSGSIGLEELPKNVLDESTVYEITLDGLQPSPSFMRRQQDLEEFRKVYLEFFRELRRSHGPLEEIHVFPAVPAPAAVVCGRGRLHKVDPALVVYDFDKKKGGFRLTLKVN